MSDIEKKFDLAGPTELQMRESKIKTAEDLPSRYRFTAPVSTQEKIQNEHLERLSKIPGVKILRGAGNRLLKIDIPGEAITKAELDDRERKLKYTGNFAVFMVFSTMFICITFLYMAWKVLSADPGPPPNEPIGSKVYLEIYQEDERVGTVVLGLYTERCPLTCENFHRLVTGNTGDGATLRGSDFFHIFGRVGIVGGDYVRNTGSGGRPVLPYFPGKRWFPDELPGKDLPFFKGALCSVGPVWSKSPGQNDSLFMISSTGTMKHNHSFVIFGEVLSGIEYVEWCTKVRRRAGVPVRRLWIKRCGEYHHTPEERDRSTLSGPAFLNTRRH
eukprot:TRINITY_DN11689_c0_g1_i1.p1 TRINITY_DN11689_c0_g1~~TRINITY_DN11689_c0_g1_i1.p1  ORF type:complete len:387 (+),score=51.01 TRINITY_DN11689_c0_g1_i1:174-1163(+)